MRKKKLFKTTLTEKDIIFKVYFKVRCGYHKNGMHKAITLAKMTRAAGYFDGIQCFDGWTPKIIDHTPMIGSDNGFLMQKWLFKANIHGIWRWVIRVPENVGQSTYINDEQAYQMTREELARKLNRKSEFSDVDVLYGSRGRYGCSYSLDIVVPEDIISEAIKRIFGKPMREIDNPDDLAFIQGKLDELEKHIDIIYKWIDYLKANDTTIAIGHKEVNMPHFEIDFRQYDIKFKE